MSDIELIEPVALVDEVASRCNGEPIFNGLGSVSPGDKLYNKAQLLVAQAYVAEACARLLEDFTSHPSDTIEGVLNEHSAAIRNGEWRNYA